MGPDRLESGRLTGGGWLFLLVTLAGYFIFNKGYAYIGYLPIFTGEMTMLFYMVTLRHGSLLPKFFRTPAAKWWLIFFVYNIFTFARSGFGDLRDSLQNSIWWVYTVFFYLGYCYGGKLLKDRKLRDFENYLQFIACAAILYSLMAPASKILHELTDFLYNGNALLGDYSSYDASLSGLIAFFLFARRTRLHIIWISLGLFATAFLLQSRAGILEMMVIFLYVVFVERKVYIVNRMKLMALILTGLIVVFAALNLTYQGKHGATTLDTVGDSIYSIFFEDDTANLQGTKDFRMFWWASVIKRTCANVPTLFTGMGESVILNNASNGQGGIDRYPHNSFISVFGFTGVIGIILFLTLIFVVSWKIFRAGRLPRGTILLQWYPVFLIGYMGGAFFSTVFEAPFHSFIFWTISGIVYHLAVHSRELSTDPRRLKAIEGQRGGAR